MSSGAHQSEAGHASSHGHICVFNIRRVLHRGQQSAGLYRDPEPPHSFVSWRWFDSLMFGEVEGKNQNQQRRNENFTEGSEEFWDCSGLMEEHEWNRGTESRRSKWCQQVSWPKQVRTIKKRKHKEIPTKPFKQKNRRQSKSFLF